ncbi:MAG: PIN domain-containing protein [Candidatus Acidiferrales bacterium]
MLDANILLRAVFGSRVPHLLETYEDVVRFCSPDMCFQDARKYIPRVAERRRRDPDLALSVLEQISQVVEVVDP